MSQMRDGDGKYQQIGFQDCLKNHGLCVTKGSQRLANFTEFLADKSEFWTSLLSHSQPNSKNNTTMITI